MSAKRSYDDSTGGSECPAHNYLVVVVGSGNETESKKPKIDQPKPKYYQLNPNDPTLDPEMKKAVLKSIKSKRYRIQQSNTAANMKMQIDALKSEIVKMSQVIENLQSRDKEKDAIIERLLGMQDKSELNAANSLVQLKMQGPAAPPPPPPPPTTPPKSVAISFRFLKGHLASHKPA